MIVTDNLFGDILTDLAAAVSGGIGLAACGNINPTGAFPSMFEPVHGSAPDIAGQGKADPTATILSVALLLRHLGYEAEAARIEEAVAADLARADGTPARTHRRDRRRARRTSSRLTRRLTHSKRRAASTPGGFSCAAPGATIDRWAALTPYPSHGPAPSDNRTWGRGCRGNSDVLVTGTSSGRA